MKVLVIHASAGAGHQKAAEAVCDSLRKNKRFSATIVDALDYTSATYKYLYRTAYSWMISKVPPLWGFFFWLADLRCLLGLVRLARRVQNHLNGQALVRFLKKEKFDVIISTHFFPNEVASFLVRTRQIHSKIIGVITDYDVHSIWVGEGIDHYAVACDYTKERLIGHGVAAPKITVTGIPTHEKFSRMRNKIEVRQKLGLEDDLFTVLIATGSFGIGPIEEIIDALEGIQVCVVCGHNKKLFERLSAKKQPLVKVLPLVDNMEELMAASDIMITKPGGLSISEALVSELPLMFFNAIPGQEENNVRVLKKFGVGISGLSIKEMADRVNHLSLSREELKTARMNVKNISRPDAVSNIIQLI